VGDISFKHSTIFELWPTLCGRTIDFKGVKRALKRGDLQLILRAELKVDEPGVVRLKRAVGYVDFWCKVFGKGKGREGLRNRSR